MADSIPSGSNLEAPSPVTGKKRKRRALSDAEEQISEENGVVGSDAQEKSKMGKGKAVAKPQVLSKGDKGKARASSEEMHIDNDADEEGMNVIEDADEEDQEMEGGEEAAEEEDGDESNKPKKSKPKANTKPKVPRESKDPWKLKGAATKRDYTQMLAPPLEMFHWSRIIIDEYTYLDGKLLSLISRLTTERIWVLSGTSPTKDFPALKTIARFLDVHLGIYDDGESKSKAALKKHVDESSRECCYQQRQKCH